MSTEQLFKEFLKFYNTMNPVGMGASKAKEIKSGVAAGFDRNTASKSGTVEDGMYYPDYDENASQTLPIVYDPDAPALPDYEQEFYDSGDSFADIVEKRASAPDSFEARVRDGMNTMKQKSREREEADIFKARVRDGMNTMKQKSRAREEALLAGDGPAPEPPDAFPARVRDGMDIMRQKSRAREEAALADDAEAPTVEEMNSRNEEFGDSFDFMEGSEEYPAGRDKKADRKAERRDRKAHLKSSKKLFGGGGTKKSRKGKEPLITTEAGRTIEKTGAPARPPTLEELEAVAGDNQDMFGTGPEDGPADPSATVPDYFLGTGDMRRTGVGVPDSPKGVDVSEAAKAEVISQDPDDYEDKAIELFYNTHGTSFDPKSRKDLGKLEKMKSLLAERGGMGEMTDNQFALQFYREYP